MKFGQKNSYNCIKSLEVEVDFLSKFDVIFWDFDGVIKSRSRLRLKLMRHYLMDMELKYKRK